MTNCRTFPNLAGDGPTSGHGAARRRYQEGFISMSSQMSSMGGSAAQKPAPSSAALLTPKEAALRLRVSDSFLAKKTHDRRRPSFPADRSIDPLFRGHPHAVDASAAAVFNQRAVIGSRIEDVQISDVDASFSDENE